VRAFETAQISDSSLVSKTVSLRLNEIKSAKKLILLLGRITSWFGKILGGKLRVRDANFGQEKLRLANFPVVEFIDGVQQSV